MDSLQQVPLWKDSGTQKHPVSEFSILICLIEFWNVKDKNNPVPPPERSEINMITEASEIEIVESYKELIGSASLTFPRGTVLRTTSSPYTAPEDAKKVSVNLSQSGVVEVTRTTQTSVASVSNFAIGQRIRISLGYTSDPFVANLAKTSNLGKNIFNDTDSYNKYKSYLTQMVDGYITKVSVDTPIELECENLASALKSITCSKKILQKCTVKYFLGNGAGQLNLLKGSGLILHPDLNNTEYDLGKVEIDEELTVADVLYEWSKHGIIAWLTDYNGQPAIQVNRIYFSNASKDSIISSNTGRSDAIDIRFDTHVAKNGLSLMTTDKTFLAVEASGLESTTNKGKFFHVTVIKNPAYDPNDSNSSQYRAVNETQLSRKQIKAGKRTLTTCGTKVNMDLYYKIPYHSRKIPCTREGLYEEAIKYLEGYNMNGIEGTLTLFGDLKLRTAQKVHLVDDHNPGKNGYYLVEEVHTSFGTDGYRQTIKLPYCIKRDNQTQSDEQE